MGCNCQATKCADNRCGCRKEGHSCDSSCKCKGCKNNARGGGGGAGQCQGIKQDGTRCSFQAKYGNYCGHHCDQGDEEITEQLWRLQLQERREEELRRAEYARQAAEEKQRQQQQEELRRAAYARQAAEEKQRQQQEELRRAEYARQAAKEKERKEREKVVIENRQREIERMEKDKALRESSERLKKQEEELRRAEDARQAAEEKQRQHQEELRRAKQAAKEKQRQQAAELRRSEDARQAAEEKERKEREQLRDLEAKIKKMEEENQNKTPQHVWEQYHRGKSVTRAAFKNFKKWCREDQREPASTKSILAFYAKDRKDLLEHKDYTYDRASDAIGKGAFGEVYKAKKGITYFALKFPGTENANNDELKNEMELMKGLNHPNIVRYYGYTINDQGHMGIVLDFLDGGSLEDHLHKSKPPPVWTVEEKKKGVLQLISALRELHGIDFVHRDLKSANILLKSGSLDLYLCDFGMTLKKDEDSQGKVIPVSAGTKLYMAPELFRSGIPPREIDRWKCADIYALCSVIGEIVTGKEPHADLPPPRDVEDAVLNSVRPFSHEDLGRVLTDRGTNVVVSGWNGDPENRPNLGVLYGFLELPVCWLVDPPP